MFIGKHEATQMAEMMLKALRNDTHAELAERLREAHATTHGQHLLYTNVCMILELIKE